MSNQEDRPKLLWEALEEEFVALGGELSAEYRAVRDDTLAKRPREPGAEVEIVLPALYRCVHAQARAGRKTTALCFSGGGIRSATFNLGVLQRLTELNLLDKFDYLSTVSGGGYLGSWLSSWIQREPRGLEAVVETLQRSATDAAAPPTANGDRATRRVSPVTPEPAPLRHLRTYSRYLSPKPGLFSADTWTLAAIYVRNLALNWLVLIPLIVAALMIPRLCTAVVAVDPVWRGTPFLGLRAPHMMYTLLACGVLLAAWAFAYAGLHQPSGRESRAARAGVRKMTAPSHQEAHGGSQGQIHFLTWCWLPLILSAMALSTFWAWAGDLNDYDLPHFLALGIALGVIGWTVFAASDGALSKLFELPWVVVAGAGAGLALWGSAIMLDTIVGYRPDPWKLEPTVGVYYATLVCLGLPLILASFGAGATLYLGLSSRLRSSRDEDREWWARAGAWFLLAVLAWLAISVVVLFGPALVLLGSRWAHVTLASVGGVAGVVTLFLARSPATPANHDERARGGAVQVASRVVMGLAAPIAIALLVIGLSAIASLLLFTTWIRTADPRFVADFFPEIGPLGGGFWLDRYPDYFRMLYVPSPLIVAGWMVVLVTFGLAVSRVINLNKFSMHGMYRDRIVRGYLGASRAGARDPDPFTGFDPDDNLPLHWLRRETIRRADIIDGGDFVARLAAAARGDPAATPADPVSAHLVGHLTKETREKLAATNRSAMSSRDTSALLGELNSILYEDDLSAVAARGVPADPQPARVSMRNRLLLQAAYPGGLRALAPRQVDTAAPLHVVNVALNLVSGDDPAWQERKAESFTASPLHCGSARLGYRDARAYGGPRGITLGTAVTISGAAVSPNMGYNSSKPIAFLMTLFNVRLGWWLGNPGPAGEETYRRGHPVFTVTPLAAEAFGLSDAEHPYVYLSDGGHFENLGLYEMVRRRCHTIVLGDGGRDPKCAFEDLGNALRKIRIDMGIPVTFPDGLSIRARDAADASCGKYCAVGEIDYKSVDGPDAVNGVLLYLKPAFYGKEPPDVFNYARCSDDFPHESTADQFFSESQFESYRALGYHVVQQVWDLPTPPAVVEQFLARARAYAGSKTAVETDPPNWSADVRPTNAASPPMRNRSEQPAEPGNA